MEFRIRTIAFAVGLAMLACGIGAKSANGQETAFLPPPQTTISQSAETPIETATVDESISQELADWIAPRQNATANSPASTAISPTATSVSAPTTSLPTASVAAPASREILEYQSPAYPEPINLGSIVLRLFGGTAIVLAGCVAFLWFGKNWLNKGSLFQGDSNAMRVVETLGLAPGCCLKLVEIEGRRFAAAIDSTGIKELVLLGETFDESLAALDGDETNQADAETAEQDQPEADANIVSLSQAVSSDALQTATTETPLTKLSDLLSAKEPGHANRRSA